MKYLIYLFLATVTLLYAGCERDEPLTTNQGGNNTGDTTTMVVALNPMLVMPTGISYVNCPVTVTGSALAGATLRLGISNGSNVNSGVFNGQFDVAGTYEFTLTATLDGRSEEISRSITIIDQETFSEVYQQNDGYTRAHKLVPLPGGGFVSYGDFCRTVGVNDACELQGFLVQWHGPDGAIRTSRAYSNATVGFVARAITVAHDGKVVVAYERISQNPDTPVRLCLMKTGETGDADWNTTKESTWDFAPRAVLETSDGLFVVGGYARRRSDGIARAGMYWFTSGGASGNNVPFGPLNSDSRIERLVEKAPGEILGLMVHDNRLHIANSVNTSIADLGLGGYVPAGITVLADGRSIVTASNGLRTQVLFLAANGAVLENRGRITTDVVLQDAILLENSHLLVGGLITEAGISRAYLAEITIGAELIWEQKHRNYSRFRGLAITEDCGILATGYYNPPGADRGAEQAYLVKLGAKGEL